MQVDISQWVLILFSNFVNILYTCYETLDNIIIFNGENLGFDFSASLLDFSVGIIVISIVLGAFYKINRPDTFYSER